MKNLIVTIILVISSLTFAQENGKKGEKLSSEQQTELQVKKMTLELDLDLKQQKELKVILLENAKKRIEKITEMREKKKKGVKLSAEEKFEMKSKMLENKIENKVQMKKILRPEQYEKWEQYLKNKKQKKNRKIGANNKKRKVAQKSEE